MINQGNFKKDRSPDFDLSENTRILKTEQDVYEKPLSLMDV